MSKFNGYVCDCCGKLIDDNEKACGVIHHDDLFDKMNAFKHVSNPEKTECHYSIECYREQVLNPASNQVNRKVDEHGYVLKLKELHFSLMSKAFHNHLVRKRMKKR